jgi:hypothetical protein
MKKLERWFRNKLPVFGLVIAMLSPACGAATSSSGNLSLSKKLIGPAGGVAIQGGGYSINFAWGESLSGTILSGGNTVVESGYLGGRFGAGQLFHVVSSSVASTPSYFQNGLQVGVQMKGYVQLVFSDPLDITTLAGGLQGKIIRDNLANATDTPVALKWTYDPVMQELNVYPDSAWQGNRLYDITVTPALRSVDAYTLDAITHVQFLTMADPKEQNIVLDAASFGGAGTLGVQSAPSLRIDIPQGSLSDYSVVLFNTAPDKSSWNVNPQIIQEANQKAQDSGGLYQAPVGLLEIAAYNTKGQRVSALAQPAQISVNYGDAGTWLSGTPAPVRTSTLSLWSLDQENRLWVKIPASQSMGAGVVAPITRLSVFSLMGSASGSASDVYVFPTPWRPAGPHAGDGSGQSGSEAGGLTFSNLPSECSIRIYTLDGEKVRELHHSDTLGPVAQEKWDGNTAGGSHAASGVYLWRVESAQDGKNGKLMIIR